MKLITWFKNLFNDPSYVDNVFIGSNEAFRATYKEHLLNRSISDIPTSELFLIMKKLSLDMLTVGDGDIVKKLQFEVQFRIDTLKGNK